MNQEADDGGAPDEAALREQLALVLLGGFVHDVGSPLAALTSNLSVAKELADADDEASRAELREVLDDLEMATTRLTELAADLRGYVGLPVGRGTFDELARCALRLARSHLSRRAHVELVLDPALRPAVPAARVLRTLGELLVAMTRDVPSGAKGHVLTVRTEADAFVVEIKPPPPVSAPTVDASVDTRNASVDTRNASVDTRDPSAAIGVAAGQLSSQSRLSKDASQWVVRVPMSWI